jgi:ABC-type multidrug transport system fused ATPase/permease subunit
MSEGNLIFYLYFMRYENMSEVKPDTWMSWVALATAIMAVFAAVTTLYMGKYSSRAILNQGQETSQWAYYQAKSIKSYIYEIQKQKMELETMVLVHKPKAVMDKYSQLIRDYDTQIKRYEVEKSEIKANADALAKSKEDAQARAGNFGYALIFLQIAIMLASISALTKKRPLFYVGLVTVIGWLFFFLDAILLFH